jgi:hypothetical protein
MRVSRRSATDAECYPGIVRPLLFAAAVACVLAACAAFTGAHDDGPGGPTDGGDGDAPASDAPSEVNLGAPDALVMGASVLAITTDATRIYWSSPMTSEVRSIPKPGKGDPDAGVVVGNRYQPGELAVDDLDIFVGEGDSHCAGGFAPLQLFTKSTGTIEDINSVTCNWGGVTRIASDVASVVAVQHQEVDKFTTVTLITKPSVGGQVLARGIFTAGGVAVFGTNVYWTNSDIARIERSDIDGGFANGGEAVDLAADETRLYWIERDGSVHSLDHATPGAPPKLLATDPGVPARIAVDDRFVYWTNRSAGRVMAVPKDGGAIVTVATSQAGPYAIVADRDGIFWTNRDDGSIGAVAKLP